MGKIILTLVLVFALANNVLASPPAQSSLDEIIPITDGMTVTPDQMVSNKPLVNVGWEATGEISLSTPGEYKEFTVWAAVAQTIEVDFPTDANPYLNGAQIGANYELVLTSGNAVRVIYYPATGAWYCWMLWGVTTAKADD